MIIASVEQLGAFGKPGRDPRSHTVSIAYVGFANANAEVAAADDADEVEWFSVSNLPELAFDHADIIQLALEKHHL